MGSCEKASNMNGALYQIKGSFGLNETEAPVILVI